jgi:hypothetical protein
LLESFQSLLLWHQLCITNRKKRVPVENDTLDVLVNIAKGGALLHHLKSVLKSNTTKEFKLFYKENYALQTISRPKSPFEDQ